MNQLRALIRAAGAFAILFVCVYVMARLSRAEIDYHSPSRIDAVVRGSLGVADRCAREIDPELRDALVTYLAIEDYFRPTAVRKFEFWLAALGAQFGVQIVSTIGIGQISYVTFQAGSQSDVRNDDRSLKRWVSELQDDCKNISVLQTVAKTKVQPCTANRFACFRSYVCLWHTGNSDNCLRESRFQSYAEDVLAIYSKVLSNQRLPAS